jgi:hypothetical protein
MFDQSFQFFCSFCPYFFVSLLFLVVSVHSHSIVSDTTQKGHSGDGIFSMTCLCVARVYPVLSLDITSAFFLLRLVESSLHFIVSFLNLMVFFSCVRISFLFFASIFFSQLIRSCGGYSSLARSLRPHVPSRSP